MNELLISFTIIFSFFLLAFVMINIRQIFTGNEFRGTCASNNPMIKNNLGECTVCGKMPDEECKLPSEA